MRGSPQLSVPFDPLLTATTLLIVAVVIIAILAIFKSSIFNRLDVRITVLIFGTGLATIVMAFAFNAITSDTLSPLWLRHLQVALVVLGGPIVLGLLAASFVRRPLRQFNNAIASIEKNDTKVQLQPTGIIEFDEVFTKFNSLMQRLQHEERLRKDLVSDTSHELNTPLTVMIGQLTAIQEDKYQMTKERVVLLKEQAERLAELVQQLDTYTKARRPNTASPEDIPLGQLCDDLVRQFGLELKQKGIAVALDIPAGCTVRANRGALQQILTNLLQNSMRYSGASKITISASSTSLTFADNGKGVPAESLPHLFERFYRVERSRSRSTGGLGLGLAIVRELSEGQGWSIVAENTDPGLAFTLTFGANNHG